MKPLNAAFALAALLSLNAKASPVLTIQCDEPVGRRVDFFRDKVEEDDDRFTGVHPVFVLDDAKPNRVTIINFASATKEAVVVVRTDVQITAVRAEPGSRVEMYTFYPKDGFMLMADHGDNVLGITGRLFWAKCTFAKSGR